MRENLIRAILWMDKQHWTLKIASIFVFGIPLVIAFTGWPRLAKEWDSVVEDALLR